MIRSRLTLLLLALLLASLILNVWQWWSHSQEQEPWLTVAPARPVKESRGLAGVLPKEPRASVSPEDAGGESITASASPAATDTALWTEDELLYSRPGLRDAPEHGKPSPATTREKLAAISAQGESKATHFSVRAVLTLPGGRTLDLGTALVKPGLKSKFSRLKEFPFPSELQLANLKPTAGIYPVIPTVPTRFETRNSGLEVEIDVTPVGGMLALGGQLTHRTFDGFGRMPGEAFAPIIARGVNAAGQPEDVILSENKLLQPQFSVSETPFIAAVDAGGTVRVPVRMNFGQTQLELTCTPVD